MDYSDNEYTHDSQAEQVQEEDNVSEVSVKVKKGKKNVEKVKKTVKTKKKTPAKKKTKKSPAKKDREESYPRDGKKAPMGKKGKNDKKYEKTPEEIVDESWKLFRNRYAMIFHICKSCNTDMYHDDEKFEYDEDLEKHCLKLKMCSKCAMSNLSINNIYYMGFEADKRKKV